MVMIALIGCYALLQSFQVILGDDTANLRGSTAGRTALNGRNSEAADHSVTSQGANTSSASSELPQPSLVAELESFAIVPGLVPGVNVPFVFPPVPVLPPVVPDVIVPSVVAPVPVIPVPFVPLTAVNADNASVPARANPGNTSELDATWSGNGSSVGAVLSASVATGNMSEPELDASWAGGGWAAVGQQWARVGEQMGQQYAHEGQGWAHFGQQMGQQYAHEGQHWSQYGQQMGQQYARQYGR